MATKAAPKGKFSLTTKVGPGSFKQPVWVWGVVGIGAYYIYTRATAAQPSTTAEPEADTSYTGYTDTGYGAYDSGGGGGAGYTAPYPTPAETVEPPPTTEAGIDGEGGGGGNRDRRQAQRRKRITKKIHQLQRGGVTKAERPRVQKLRARRKSLRG